MRTPYRLAVAGLVVSLVALATVRSDAQPQKPQLQKPLPGKMEAPSLPQAPGLPCLADTQNHAARLVQADVALRNALPAEGARLGSLPNEVLSISAHVISLASAAVTTVTAFAPATAAATASRTDIQTKQQQETVQRWKEQWQSVKDRYAQSLQALASRATTDGMRKAAQGAAATIGGAGDPVANCMQASLQGGQGPQIPGAVAGAFETDIAGFHVKLESGAANRGAGTMTLTGTVSVTPLGNAPPLRLVFKNSNTLVGQGPPPAVASIWGTASTRPSGSMAGRAQPLRATAGKAIVGAQAGQPETWASYKATGSLDVQAGSVTFTIQNATLQLANDGTAYLSGGEVSLLGCSQQVNNGSAVRADAIELWGQIRCGNLVAADSLLALNAGGAGGGVRIPLFGHGFDLNYTLGSGKLQGSSTWSPTSRDWQAVPGIGSAQFRVTNPRVILRIDGASAGPGFYVDRVEARSTANKPNGEPWTSAWIVPAPVTPSSAGAIPLPLPILPAAQALPAQYGDCLCDASCGELSTFGLGALVFSGTGFGSAGGKIEFVDQWHGQCRITQRSQIGSGPLDGKCQADTKCPAGWQKYADGGVWKCQLPGAQPPAIPTLPTSVSIQLNTVAIVP